jgi:hypothetical protein
MTAPLEQADLADRAPRLVESAKRAGADAQSEITIAGHLREMFLRIRPANNLAYRFATNAPTVAVEGMTVAGR